MKATRGFTLVEILIVVVILGILAAIVVPQFTQASTEAKMNSLCSNLQSLRSQIELYKVQHNDLPPLAANFSAQMTETTDIGTATTRGTPSGTKVRSATNAYGPYLERVPENPFDNSNAVTAVANQAAAGSGAGWAYVEATGEIYANDPGTTGITAHKGL
jgi:general secretion pathway protein G